MQVMNTLPTPFSEVFTELRTRTKKGQAALLRYDSCGLILKLLVQASRELAGRFGVENHDWGPDS